MGGKRKKRPSIMLIETQTRNAQFEAMVHGRDNKINFLTDKMKLRDALNAAIALDTGQQIATLIDN
eukprot:6457750-Heterocapsa_arctica.AAC.1